MPIATIRTMLSLDRYAATMGLSPVQFSGFGGVQLSNGNLKYPVRNDQTLIWPQSDYQSVDKISREQIARLISQAEFEISSFLGWYPTKTWIEQESHSFMPITGNNGNLYCVGFQLDKVKFISGGRRKSVVVEEDSEVQILDLDNDGFSETYRVIIANPTTPYEQYKVYFPDYDGDPVYEIRTPRTKKVYGNELVIDFNAWQMLLPEAAFENNGEDGEGLDLTDIENLTDKVDIYREYNDTTQDHVIFHGDDGDNGGYIVPSDNMGYIKAYPALFDSNQGAWCRSGLDEMSYADFWYYAGNSNPTDQIIKNEDDYINPTMATAIAFLATSRLDRPVVGNSNIESLFTDLMHDYTADNSNENAPFDLQQCAFGTRKGEYKVWRMLSRFQTRRFNSVTI